MARPGAVSASARVARGAGENGVGRVRLGEIQRARILAGMFEVASERGAGSVSVADVVERSGVSRRTFYEVFDDREDCFLAAFDDAVSYASERVLPAYRAEEKWRDRIRAGLVAFLVFLDYEPVIGRLLVCESLAGGGKTLERRGRVLALLTRAVDEGRNESANTASLPELTAEGLVGGVISVIQARLAERDHDPLVELASPLVSMVVLPYLGRAAAARELERPVPVRAGGPGDGMLLADPFKDAGMRLTYRTLRVLLAVAERPGASNRQVGDSAGIADQGQVSKVLARLQRIALLSNTGVGAGQGAPNEWSLTSTGRQVVASVRAHTESFE